MRAVFLVACASVALGTGIACATSEDEAASPPDPEAVARDAAIDAPVVDAAVIEPPAPATCTSAGWCVTPLPDADLTLIDIWPFKGRAFAVAVSASLGAKVLEWVEADHRWTYIDDDTQNEDGLGRYVGRIWAPNEGEVYYTVEPGYVYHGTRGATWSWERTLLVPASVVAGGDLSAPLRKAPESAALGVWGTSGDDVYAWRADTIYHRTSVDGGAPEWVVDYARPGWSERMAIFSAGGSRKDDVWFSGANSGNPQSSLTSSTCPLLLRRTPDGYQTVVAGEFAVVPVPFPRFDCVARPGTVALTRFTKPGEDAFQSPGDGAMTDVHVGADGEIAALRYAATLTRLVPEDGGYVSTSENPFQPRTPSFTLTSLWVQGDEAWLSAPGFLLRGPVAGGAGAFAVSTVALTGAPIGKTLYRIRGTDAENLWAIGARYAFHKTTP